MVMGLVAAACVSQPARAEQGDWLFRAGASMIDPKNPAIEDPFNGAPFNEGDIVYDDSVSAAASVAYMLTDHLATELWLAWPFNLDVSLKSQDVAGDMGEVELLAPTLSLQWHFNPGGRVQPFVGVGVNYSTFSSEPLDATDVFTPFDIEMDHSWGAAAQAGLNLALGERWFVGADVRWIDIDSDTRLKPGPDPQPGIPKIFRPGGQKAEIDPWLYGLYIGYRIPAGRAEPVAPRAATAAAVAPAAAAPAVQQPAPPPPAKCSDGDNDGVCDADDKCPGTPAGIKVDSVGCPLEQRLKLLFDFDSAELRPESLSELERLVKFMGDVPFATALIEGHTDSVGTDAYNQSLSDRRAKAVFDYLSSRGVDPARLKSIGKGESEPIADNKTAEGRQDNRRVLMIRTDSGR
jgi:outer membrane protein W/outer membrane protein OmpA-like peptidoglycan-associated protein